MQQEKQKLRDWLLRTIETEYAEDIDLVIVHDHLVLPEDDFKKAFDFFVPATPRGEKLARTFIIHDIGLDLYPRSWERLEGMARLEDWNTGILADARIIYSRTPEAAARFANIQEKLRANLADPAFMYQKALENLNSAMELYKTMLFKETMSSLRLAAGYIRNYLAIALAYLNRTYLKNSQEDILEELAQMPMLPEGILPMMRKVIDAVSAPQLKELCYQMIWSVRRLLEEQQEPAAAEKGSELSGLADWYHELAYTWRRIRYYCRKGDGQRSYQWGIYLQEELNVVCEEFGLEPMDLMGQYDPGDLMQFAGRADAFEQRILAVLAEHKVPVLRYACVDDFVKDYEAGKHETI